MPYCRNCGKEINEDARFCPYCGVSQSIIPSQKEKVVVLQKPSSDISSLVGVAIFITVLLGVFFFAATVEIFDCPRCNNSPVLRWACSHCGRDGKVTLIELLVYSLSHLIVSLPKISFFSMLPFSFF